MTASLNPDAGDCKLCPVPKKTLSFNKSTPGAFHTALPAGANFLTRVIIPFLVYSAFCSIL